MTTLNVIECTRMKYPARCLFCGDSIPVGAHVSFMWLRRFGRDAVVHRKCFEDFSRYHESNFKFVICSEFLSTPPDALNRHRVDWHARRMKCLPCRSQISMMCCIADQGSKWMEIFGEEPPSEEEILDMSMEVFDARMGRINTWEAEWIRRLRVKRPDGAGVR